MIIRLVLPLLIPPLVFAICALGDGLSLSEMLSAMLEQYQARRQNLLITGLTGLFPVLLLQGILWLYSRRGGNPEVRRMMTWAGYVPIILILIWVNFEFWPVFFPARTYPGFPHGLEFVIGPFLYAPGLMLVGVVSAWLLGRNQNSRD